MSTELHTIKPKQGSIRTKKRLGRGNASGWGTYSGRGLKGQRARSGGKGGLKLKGFKKSLLSIPKLRGFNSMHPQAQAISLSTLEKNYKDNEEVSPISLTQKNIITSPKQKCKILNTGEIKKKLTIKNCLISKSAATAVEKAGGKVYNEVASSEVEKKLEKKDKTEKKQTKLKNKLSTFNFSTF